MNKLPTSRAKQKNDFLSQPFNHQKKKNIMTKWNLLCKAYYLVIESKKFMAKNFSHKIHNKFL